jgi:hypothetical protein
MLADVWTWFHFWLYLHIMAVIVAFGPTFAFPLMGAYASKHVEHAPAVAHLTDLIERRMTLPIGVAVPLLGTALIYTGHFDLWKSEWLVIAIVLYTIAYLFALLVQSKNGAALIKAIAALPPGPPPPGVTGPPPEIAAITKKLQMGGMILTQMVTIIALLMVWRPGSCQGVC